MSTLTGKKSTYNYYYVRSVTYDNLNRLISAKGSFNGYGSGDAQKKASYSLSMAYDDLHNITSKVQSLNQSNLQFSGALKAGYTLNYKYNPQNNQQVTEIADTSYRTTGTPVGTPGRQDFTYDANGNLVCIHTTRAEAGGRENLINTRNLLWDEENRLLGVSDSGVVGSRMFAQCALQWSWEGGLWRSCAEGR